MDESLSTARVREAVRAAFTSAGVCVETLHETILTRGCILVGRRFETVELDAIWLNGEARIRLVEKDGRQVGEVDLAPDSQTRRAA